MCGEHACCRRLCRLSRGSSPHVRGALARFSYTVDRTGIIPACAGSTRRHAPPIQRRRDHPRMCGEHRLRVAAASTCPGSSPHVRGARLPPSVGRLRLGIIPACAGSTVRNARQYPQRRDHPRMCGEHSTSSKPPLVVSGSSPHVRGALKRVCPDLG